jgi:F-type H+-transporting ATPase subunit gamma
MAKTRELRRRIRSVENTRQITKTMEMVATSRLKRAQDRVVAARPYAQALADLLGSLYTPALAERFPLLRQPDGPRKRVAVVLITSNRGLCGGFNANLIREARSRVAEWEAAGAAVELHAIGRKGIGFFKYIGRELASQRTDIGDRPAPEHAVQVVEPLMQRFAAGELDRVEVVFAKFNNPLSTPPTLLPVLPIAPPRADRRTGGQADGGRGDSGSAEPREDLSARPSVRPSDRVPSARPTVRPNYILRPSANAILDVVLPLYVHNQMYRALVETAASENGARRTAMKSATDNAGEMIDFLRRTYNRARQAQITQELAEIVGGAEALKG